MSSIACCFLLRNVQVANCKPSHGISWLSHMGFWTCLWKRLEAGLVHVKIPVGCSFVLNICESPREQYLKSPRSDIRSNMFKHWGNGYECFPKLVDWMHQQTLEIHGMFQPGAGLRTHQPSECYTKLRYSRSWPTCWCPVLCDIANLYIFGLVMVAVYWAIP